LVNETGKQHYVVQSNSDKIKILAESRHDSNTPFKLSSTKTSTAPFNILIFFDFTFAVGGGVVRITGLASLSLLSTFLAPSSPSGICRFKSRGDWK